MGLIPVWQVLGLQSYNCFELYCFEDEATPGLCRTILPLLRAFISASLAIAWFPVWWFFSDNLRDIVLNSLCSWENLVSSWALLAPWQDPCQGWISGFCRICWGRNPFAWSMLLAKEITPTSFRSLMFLCQRFSIGTFPSQLFVIEFLNKFCQDLRGKVEAKFLHAWDWDLIVRAIEDLLLMPWVSGFFDLTFIRD